MTEGSPSAPETADLPETPRQEASQKTPSSKRMLFRILFNLLGLAVIIAMAGKDFIYVSEGRILEAVQKDFIGLCEHNGMYMGNLAVKTVTMTERDGYDYELTVTVENPTTGRTRTVEVEAELTPGWLGRSRIEIEAEDVEELDRLRSLHRTDRLY